MHISSRKAATIALFLLSTSGGVAAAPSAVVVWNQAALAEVRLGKLGPPVVARALAVAHTCMYDAWTHYDPKAVGLVVNTPRRTAAEFTLANKSKAVSFAAYRCLVNLFPAGATRLDAVMRGLGYDPADTTTLLTSPQGVGNYTAQTVLANRRNDGSNQYGDLAIGAYADYTAYVPTNSPMPFCLPTTIGSCTLNIADPYHWQPLINNLFSTQRFVAPFWERVTPFALTSAAQFDGRPEVASGPKYLQSPALYQADVDQMLSISATLTAQQKLSVEYWADGPESELPPGHWSLFAQFISARDNHSIDQDAKMYFAMQNASMDAGIVAWHLKRKYGGVRPITAVRYIKQGQAVLAWGGPGRPIEMIDGGKWSPYNPGSNLSPPFPGYVSGHSTFSAASATVLRNFTGSDNFGFYTVIPPNFGRVEPGVPALPMPISFPTFSAAVADAGMSRLYAGIHFADDNTVGQVLGNLAGQQAWEKAKTLFDGGLVLTTSSSKASAEALSLSWPHTVDTLSNRLLIVGVATADLNSVASVTYGTLPLTRLAQQLAPNDRARVELWYRLAPPSGTANINVAMVAKDEIVAGAMSYTGVHQTTPFGTVRQASGNTKSACVTLANEAAPLVTSLAVIDGASVAATAGAGQTMLWNLRAATAGLPVVGDIVGTGMVGPGAPVASICEALGSSNRWGMIAVPLAPARLTVVPPPGGWLPES